MLFLFIFFAQANINNSANEDSALSEVIGGTTVHADTVEKERLSNFSTEFKNSSKNRADNIALASKSINDEIVMPGEIFSYNEAVGPTTKNNGYKLGHIFIKGKKSKGYGGGVCQVSSTLFNAAEQAGMEIVERHPHSLPVDYVPEDKDAATSYGVIDLKFKNTTDSPVKIKSWIENETVNVSLKRC